MASLVALHARAIDDGDGVGALRIARELATLALAERPNAPPSVSSEPSSSAAPGLVVGPDLAWFRYMGSRPVHLRRRRASRLLLERLVDDRLARPGTAVPATELIAAGWPGEVIRPQSALSRLYVAVSALRKLGLRDALLGQDGGYLLDPALVVTRAP